MTIDTLLAILRHGDGGEIIGGRHWENGEYVQADLDYNAVYALADRYLIQGADTKALEEANINWSEYPKVWRAEDYLPKDFDLMPKGLLLNYFKWQREQKVKQEAE